MSDPSAHHAHEHDGPRASIIWPLVLIALAAVMLRRWQDGALALYVHPGFVPYLALAALGLLGLATAQLWTALRLRQSFKSRPSVGWGVALVAAAVLVAALVPARPLGSAVAAVQASQAGGLPPAPALTLTDETATWTLLEWAQALSGGVRRERLIGRRVSVVGFVHRPREGVKPSEMMVTRFVVRCCAADGMAVSLPVRHADADSLPADTWVQVDGVLRLDDAPGDAAVYVDADRLIVVPAPASPYLSPA